MSCQACTQRLQNLLTALAEGRLTFNGEIYCFPIGKGHMTFFIDRFRVIRQVFAEDWDLARVAEYPKLVAEGFKRLGDKYIGGEYWFQREAVPIWKLVFKDLIIEAEIKDFVRVSHGKLH